jgi:RNA polymerase sigma-70 factor, ECF subfamily
MRCEVAREALSARMDGERLHVPTRRVDAHLESCHDCRAWLIAAAEQARRITTVDVAGAPDLANQIMEAAGVEAVPWFRRWWRFGASRYARCGLIAVGALLVAVALAQIAGVDFGMASATEHGAMNGAHLLHESTAWSLALGIGMIAAGIWTALSGGVAAVAGVYAVALLGYVVGDAWVGQVTASRIASHVPVLLGLVFALLVVRQRVASRRRPPAAATSDDVVLPAGARRGRRRGHLWPINHRAA